MRSCGKSFAHCKSQKMAIFFKYPLPFRGAVATFLPRKGTDNFLRIKWVDCNVSSRSSSPFPAQSSNTVFTEYIHQAPVPLHRVCPLPGILNPDLQSTITCQIPTYSSDPSQLSPLLSDPPHPELVVFSVWEERSWWIQSLPSTKPVRLPLTLSETSLINRPVRTCLNFPGSVRTNEVSGSGAAQRKHLKVCSFFFFQDQTFPRLWKHSTVSF